MRFLCYELAINPDVQQKLQSEIDNVFNSDKLSYENLLKMKYLDMVVCESLRKWSPAPILGRKCTKSFEIKPKTSEEKSLELKPGDVVWIPVHGLHYDPKVYPDPSRFDPERFNDENKSKINPLHFIPFGAGPRNCIGKGIFLIFYFKSEVLNM